MATSKGDWYSWGDTPKPLRHGEDYGVGDLVTIEMEDGTVVEARIAAIVEAEDTD